MTDYELEKFCERNPNCGCKCFDCPAFAENHFESLGYYDDEDYNE